MGPFRAATSSTTRKATSMSALPERAAETSSPFCCATQRRDEGRHGALSRQPARLRGLRAQSQVLPEHAGPQDPRSIHEAARDKARAIAQTEAYLVSRRQRKKVEMLFAHLKRILGLDRLRLRGPCGAHDEFLFAATAQNLRKLAKLIPFPEPVFAT